MKSLSQFILEAKESKYSPLGKLKSFSYKNADDIVSELANSNKELFNEMTDQYNIKDYTHPAFGFWSKISGRGEQGNNEPNGFKITNRGNKEKGYVKEWGKVGTFLQYILDNVDDLENVKDTLSKVMNIDLEEKGNTSVLDITDKYSKTNFMKFTFEK